MSPSSHPVPEKAADFSRYCETAVSRFVINTVHNNGHSESVRLVFSLCIIVLLVVAAIFVVVHMHGWPKVSFHFQSRLQASTYGVESVVY